MATLAVGLALGSTRSPAAARGSSVGELLAADSAWSAHWREAGFVRAFTDIATADVFYLTAGHPTIRGPRSVAQLLASDSTLIPAPVAERALKVGISADLDFGYTCGYTKTTGVDTAAAHGRYLAVWKRIDGRWRLAALALTRTSATTDSARLLVDEPPAITEAKRESAESARTRVLQADSSFSALATKTSVAEAFAQYAAADAVSMSGEGSMPVGPDAIRQMFSGVPPGFRMIWAPVAADAAGSGDLAFTVGEAILTVPGDAAHPTRTSYSKYLTIWQKQANGEWRFVADGGNSRPSPYAAHLHLISRSLHATSNTSLRFSANSSVGSMTAGPAIVPNVDLESGPPSAG